MVWNGRVQGTTGGKKKEQGDSLSGEGYEQCGRAPGAEAARKIGTAPTGRGQKSVTG